MRAETPASLHVSTPQQTPRRNSLVIKGASGAGNIGDSKTEKKAQVNLSFLICDLLNLRNGLTCPYSKIPENSKQSCHNLIRQKMRKNIFVEVISVIICMPQLLFPSYLFSWRIINSEIHFPTLVIIIRL